MNTNLPQLNVDNHDVQRAMVDFTLEKNTWLAEMAATSSSDGLQNVYEKADRVVGGNFVDMNEAGGTVSHESSLVQEDLNFIKGQMQVSDDDLLKLRITPQAYFNKKIGPTLNKTGMNIEDTGIYDVFQNYAVGTGNVINAGGTTADKQSSILAVRTSVGGTSLVYNPAANGAAELVRLRPINNYGITEILNNENELIDGYKVKFKGNLGFQIVDQNTVGLIKNIDDTNLPTEKELLELFRNVRRDEIGTVKCWMTQKTFDNLSQSVLSGKIQLDNNVNSLGYQLAYYQGIEFIVNRNMVDTEAVYS